MPIYKKIDRSFFKKWSRDTAYVLGFFAADGNMIKTKRGTFFFGFDSADELILESIKKLMRAEHKISTRKSDTGVWYRLQIGSKEMFDDLVRIGFKGNKSRRMKIPRVPTYLLNDFIRGYFDGDGNVWTGLMNKKSPKPRMVLQAMFTSASHGFLSDLHKKLNSLNVVGGSIRKIKNKECFRLQFSTNDALKLYEIMYNKPHPLFLKRKKDVFEKHKNAAVAQR